MRYHRWIRGGWQSHNAGTAGHRKVIRNQCTPSCKHRLAKLLPCLLPIYFLPISAGSFMPFECVVFHGLPS